MPTTPGNWPFVYPDGTTILTPLRQRFQQLAESVANALAGNKVPIVVADATQRDAKFPTPAQGDSVIRMDRGWTEMYYAAYNSSTNPAGASTAGWYPVAGKMPYAVARGTSALGVPNGAWSIGNIGFTVGWEHGGFTGPGAPNYYVTVPFPGLYDVQAWTTFSSSTGGALRAVRIAIDNASLTPTIYETRRHAVASSAFAVSGQFQSVAINTNLQLQVFQDSGGSLNSNDRLLMINYRGPVSVMQNAV